MAGRRQRRVTDAAQCDQRARSTRLCNPLTTRRKSFVSDKQKTPLFAGGHLILPRRCAILARIMHATNCEASSERSVNSIAPRNLIGSHLVLSARPVNPPLRPASVRSTPVYRAFPPRLSATGDGGVYGVFGALSLTLSGGRDPHQPDGLYRTTAMTAARKTTLRCIAASLDRTDFLHCQNYLIVVLLRQRCYRISPSTLHQVNEVMSPTMHTP